MFLSRKMNLLKTINACDLSFTGDSRGEEYKRTALRCPSETAVTAIPEPGCLEDTISHRLDMFTSSRMHPVAEFNIKRERVYYDLEASGLHPGSDILQIGAVTEQDKAFDVYITPTEDISDDISRLINLKSVDGKLFKSGVEVATVPLATALTRFCDFLEQLDGPCDLIAHGGHRFDHPRLCRAMEAHGLGGRFAACVHTFCDTFWVFKIRRIFYNGLSLASLARFHNVHLGSEEQLHDAVSDVRLLRAVVRRAAVSNSEFLRRSKTFTEIGLETDDL